MFSWIVGSNLKFGFLDIAVVVALGGCVAGVRKPATDVTHCLINKTKPMGNGVQ